MSDWLLLLFLYLYMLIVWGGWSRGRWSLWAPWASRLRSCITNTLLILGGEQINIDAISIVKHITCYLLLTTLCVFLNQLSLPCPELDVRFHYLAIHHFLQLLHLALHMKKLVYFHHPSQCTRWQTLPSQQGHDRLLNLALLRKHDTADLLIPFLKRIPLGTQDSIRLTAFVSVTTVAALARAGEFISNNINVELVSHFVLEVLGQNRHI